MMNRGENVTWKTHKNGAFTATIILFPTVIAQMSQMGFSRLHYMILPIMTYILIFSSAQYGTVLADLDHHSGAIPMKNAFTLMINKLLHFIFGKSMSHRSWQTHSVDLYLIVVGLPAYFLYQYFMETGDFIVYQGYTMLMGFMLGGIIHCVMDMFTTEGVWLSIIYAWLRSRGKKKGTYKKYRLKLAPVWFWYPKITLYNHNGKRTILPRIYRYYPITTTNTGTEYEAGFRDIIIDLNRLFMVISVIVYIKGYIK